MPVVFGGGMIWVNSAAGPASMISSIVLFLMTAVLAFYQRAQTGF
jgi:hypothetical protein